MKRPIRLRHGAPRHNEACLPSKCIIRTILKRLLIDRRSRSELMPILDGCRHHHALLLELAVLHASAPRLVLAE